MVVRCNGIFLPSRMRLAIVWKGSGCCFQCLERVEGTQERSGKSLEESGGSLGEFFWMFGESCIQFGGCLEPFASGCGQFGGCLQPFASGCGEEGGCLQPFASGCGKSVVGRRKVPPNLEDVWSLLKVDAEKVP